VRDTRVFKLALRASYRPRLRLAGGGFFVDDPRPRAAQQRSPSGSWLTSQWWAGLAERGEIGRYAPSTIARKRRMGLPWERVTLFHSGQLYSRTTIALDRREIVVRASVPYARYLVRRYGDRILWLGGAYLQRWQAELVDNIIKSLKQQWLSGE